MTVSAIVTAITSVFGAISDWVVDAIPKAVGIFYNAEAGLTFLGVLALMALGVSVFFLLMGLVQNFLHFRG